MMKERSDVTFSPKDKEEVVSWWRHIGMTRNKTFTFIIVSLIHVHVV